MNSPYDSASELERKREAFISTADELIPEEVKKLLSEVARYAPPKPILNDEVTVSVEGSSHADTE